MRKLLYILAAICVARCAYAGNNEELNYLYRDLPFRMEPVVAPSIPAHDFLLTDYGAVGDGLTLNTEAFAKAVNMIESAGGGRLIVPAGIWLTGPISMCGKMELHLQKGAVIIFSPDMNAYPLVDTFFEGLQTKRCQSPISARGVSNIAITGQGVIDGSGDAWRPVKKNKIPTAQWVKLIKSGGVLNDSEDMWYPSEQSKLGDKVSDMNVPAGLTTDKEWASVKDFLRPVMISLLECNNVLLEGVTFRNSPAWNIHPMLCRGIIIRRITVQNPWYAQNGDGVDIESCDGVIIVDSSFDVGDDAICIKSGKDKQGRDRAAAARNIIIDNCTVYHGHGGFVVGSEMSGGVNNISVSNCRFLGTDVGLRFKSKRGRGGVVENIHIRNIIMTDIPAEPILFDLFYGGKSAMEDLEQGEEPQSDATPIKVDQTTPLFRDIYISGVTCNGARRAMYFNGLPEMNIGNVTVKNCSIASTYGAQICESDGVLLQNLNIEARHGPALQLNNVKKVNIEGFKCPDNIEALNVKGSSNSNIKITNSTITNQNSTIDPSARGSVTIQ